MVGDIQGVEDDVESWVYSHWCVGTEMGRGSQASGLEGGASRCELEIRLTFLLGIDKPNDSNVLE